MAVSEYQLFEGDSRGVYETWGGRAIETFEVAKQVHKKIEQLKSELSGK